jgi:hypothetical protein
MNYQEKTHWLSLIVCLYIISSYLIDFFQLQTAAQLSDQSLYALIVNAIVWMVILEVVSQISLAIIDYRSADENLDERDTLFNLRSYKVGYYVLSISMVGVFSTTFLGQMFNFEPFVEHISPIGQVLHAMLIALMMAECSTLIARVVQYRLNN